MTSPPPATGHVLFEAARATTLAALRRLLDAHGGSGRCLLVDLGLGAWRGHEAARQLADQLGLTPRLPHPRPVTDAAPPGTLLRYAEQISAGIDVEAGGDPGTRAAALLADQVMAALGDRARRTTVLVLIPRPGAGWEGEDVVLVSSLAARLRRAGGMVRLVATGDGRPVLPASWAATFPDSSPAADPVPPPSDPPLGLVPGLLDPMLVLALRADATRLADLPMLRGSRLVIPPEWRPAAGNVPPAGYDELAARACGVAWLRAYAQAHGSATAADPGFLGERAWAAFRAGGSGVALRLAERAVDVARSERDQAALRALLNGMRIALFRYAEAAASPDPSPELPPSLRGFLLQVKGWGLAMAPNVAQACHAEPYLAQARELLTDSADEREYLYLLNISALARMKAGHPEEALRWEREIEVRAGGLTLRDYRLEYVNAINQARLYRRLGDHPAAKRYYQHAFATAEGLRSESDAVHANACLGRLATEAGKIDEAYRCWLRTALHWLSMGVPEALAWRVIAVVLGRRPAPTEDLLDMIGGALADRLAALAAQRGLGDVVAEAYPDGGSGVPGSPGQKRPRSTPPWFARYAGPVSGVALTWGATGDGWSVFGADPVSASGGAALPASEAQDTPQQRRLRRIVPALLSVECPDDHLARSDTLYIHDNHGCEMPTDAAGLVRAAVLAGVRVLLIPGGRTTLSPQALAELRGRARVRIGPGVHRIEPRGPGAVVHFRRYRPPLDLTADQYRLVTFAAAGISLTGLANRAASALDALTAARVLVVDLPEERCTGVGARPLTSTSWTPR